MGVQLLASKFYYTSLFHFNKYDEDLDFIKYDHSTSTSRVVYDSAIPQVAVNVDDDEDQNENAFVPVIHKPYRTTRFQRHFET